MKIALPESLGPLVRRRVEDGGHASAEEYLQALILADDKPARLWEDLTEVEREEVERIDRVLLKSLASGPPIVADDAYWEAKKQRSLREG